MTLPNHLLGGAVFTGVFGATVSGVNLLASPWNIAITLFAAALPDIDNPQSPIGRAAGPLSHWINRRYGHRTITHSLFALLALTLLVAFLQFTRAHPSHNAHLFFWAYLSHILFDMLTLQGVKLFYPFHKAAAVIPGDPRFRLETGNLRHETLFFCLAALCFLLLQPLFKQGFWTSYNRLFGTIKHVNSEFHKSADLLEVAYEYRTGSELRRGKGYCLEASQKHLLLLENGSFHHIDEAKVEVQKTIPAHTGKTFRFQDHAFVGVSADSLNSLLRDKKIMSIEIHANRAFEVDNGRVPEVTRRFQAECLSQIRVRPAVVEEPGANREMQRDTLIHRNNPRIAAIRRKIRQLEQRYEAAAGQFREARRRIRELKTQGERVGEGDILRYEAIRDEIHVLEKVREPEEPALEIDILKTEMLELQNEDALRYREKVVARDNVPSAAEPGPARFTGYFRCVLIL